MAAIQKRKGPRGTRYRAVVRITGHPSVSRTFSQKTLAKQWAVRTEAAIREGRDVDTASARRTTVAKLIDEYLKKELPRRKLSSYEDHSRHVKHWRDRIGQYAAFRITPDLLVDEQDELSSKLSPATVNRHMAALSAVLQWAVAKRKIPSNPARLVKRLPEPDGRERFLSDKERERLLKSCRASSDPRLYPLVLTSLGTGARRGELMKLGLV